MKVGFCQFQVKLLDKQYNINKMLNLIKDKDADLLVFPELATSGYLFQSKEELLKASEDLSQKNSFDIFKELAIKKNCSFVIGFPELSGDKIFNSCILINPDGNHKIYRKIHLFYKEKKFFSPGDKEFFVSTIKNGVKIGMMICFDWMFPESCRSLTLQGAQIIVHPANLVLPWCQQAMITRSIENRVFSITANRIGKDENQGETIAFTGKSQIISPDGIILNNCSESEETSNIIEINPESSNNKQINPYNNIIIDRKEEFYFL